MVEDQVDPRPGDEGRQASQKIYRLKNEVARAVRPRGLELQNDAALGREAESERGQEIGMPWWATPAAVRKASSRVSRRRPNERTPIAACSEAPADPLGQRV